MSSHTNAHAWGTEACRLMSPLDARKEDEGRAKAAGAREARRSMSARGKEQTGKRSRGRTECGYAECEQGRYEDHRSTKMMGDGGGLDARATGR